MKFCIIESTLYYRYGEISVSVHYRYVCMYVCMYVYKFEKGDRLLQFCIGTLCILHNSWHWVSLAIHGPHFTDDVIMLP